MTPGHSACPSWPGYRSARLICPATWLARRRRCGLTSRSACVDRCDGLCRSEHFDLRRGLAPEDVQEEFAWRTVESRSGPALRTVTRWSVPAHTISSPAPRSLRLRKRPPRRTFRHKAASKAGVRLSRGPRPLALRTSSWWTKYSFRFATERTHPMRNNPGGGPDRIRATSHPNSFALPASPCATRRTAEQAGRTRQGPATGSRSRSTMWAARSRAVQPSRSVGASAPSSSKRSHRARRSCASNGRSRISPMVPT